MPRNSSHRTSKGQSQWQRKQQQDATDGKDIFEEEETMTRSSAAVSHTRVVNRCKVQSQRWQVKQQQSAPARTKKHQNSELFEAGSSTAVGNAKGSPATAIMGVEMKPPDNDAFPHDDTVTRSVAVSNARSSPATVTMGVEMKLLDNGCFPDDDNVTRSSPVNTFMKLSASDVEPTHHESKPTMCDDSCLECKPEYGPECDPPGEAAAEGQETLMAAIDSNSETLEEATAPSGKPTTVAIFADYDGCFDIISPSNPSGAKMDKMFDYAEQIGRLLHPRKYAQKILEDFLKEVTTDAERVVVFSGSNRQSHKADEFNSVQNDNGLAMVGLKKLAEEKGWQFNANLLEDAGLNPSDIMNSVGGSSKIKQMLVENNFKHLKGRTTVYFLDDVEKYLKFTRINAEIPENIELKTVLFDWYGICIDGTQDAPLVAISAESR